LLVLPGLGRFTLRDAFTNVAFIGSQGSGKTSSAKTYYRALLLEQFGGLVLCVKQSQIDEFVTLCRECGRERDVIILGTQQSHRYNPLEGASLGAATSLLVELADILSERDRNSSSEAAFWRQQSEIMLDRLLVLCRAFHGRMDIMDIAKMFAGRANDLMQVVNPVWRQKSIMASALDAVRTRPEEELQRAVEYFEHDFPTHGDKLQGSLAATVSGILENLRKEPLLRLFGGQSTFQISDLFSGGKICVVAVPTQGSEAQGISPNEGKIANGLMQFCFCRAVTQAKRESNVFLIADECQETISNELQRQLSVMREYRVATVLLTQDLAALDVRLGKDIREAVLSKCATKVFLRQDHGGTRKWAAEEIGKCKREKRTDSRTWQTGGTAQGVTTSLEEDWRVPPEKIATLKTGGTDNGFIVESVVLRKGRWKVVGWHQQKPGKKGTVKIA
jgi:type IV secretory pathway TraG/TraD family ATPase VirD4